MRAGARFRQRGDLCFVEDHTAAGEAVAHRPPSDGPLALAVKLRALASEPNLFMRGCRAETRVNAVTTLNLRLQTRPQRCSIIGQAPLCLPRKGKAQLLADPLHLLRDRARAWGVDGARARGHEHTAASCRKRATKTAADVSTLPSARSRAARSLEADKSLHVQLVLSGSVRAAVRARTAERRTPRTVEA